MSLFCRGLLRLGKVLGKSRSLDLSVTEQTTHAKIGKPFKAAVGELVDFSVSFPTCQTLTLWDGRRLDLQSQSISISRDSKVNRLTNKSFIYFKTGHISSTLIKWQTF